VAHEEAPVDAKDVSKWDRYEVVRVADPADSKPARFSVYGITAEGVRVKLDTLYLHELSRAEERIKELEARILDALHDHAITEDDRLSLEIAFKSGYAQWQPDDPEIGHLPSMQEACISTQTKLKAAEERERKLLETADPFVRAVRISEPLHPSDDLPARDVLPPAWIQWRHLKALATAVLAPAERAPEPERIRLAAIMTTGRSHAECLGKVRDLRAQGFVTDSGRFVFRDEALRIATAAGQLEGRTKHRPFDLLMSEDLWYDEPPAAAGTGEGE
jgi:hypothetical protein